MPSTDAEQDGAAGAPAETRFRYRLLQLRRTSEAVRQNTRPMRGWEAGNLAFRYVGVVDEVDAQESEATHAELVRWLRNAEVMPSDLVLSPRAGWTTFKEAPEFYEACEGLVDQREFEGNARAVFFGALGVAFMVLYYWFLLWLRARP